MTNSDGAAVISKEGSARMEGRPAPSHATAGQLRDALKGDFRGVAKCVKDAQQKVGGDRVGVAIHNRGDAGAGSANQTSDFGVGQSLPLDNFHNLGVEIGAQFNFGTIHRIEAEGLGEFRSPAGFGEPHRLNVSYLGHPEEIIHGATFRVHAGLLR